MFLILFSLFSSFEYLNLRIQSWKFRHYIFAPILYRPTKWVYKNQSKQSYNRWKYKTHFIHFSIFSSKTRVTVGITAVVGITVVVLRLWNLMENRSNTSDALFGFLRMRQRSPYTLTWHRNTNALIAAAPQ